MQQALAAQAILAERYGVAAEVYSVPSFQLLRNEALDVEHWNLHNPSAEQRVPVVTQVLAAAAAAGPVVAVSDWIAAWPDMVSRWVPTKNWHSLGTDGYGRSDTREELRRFFDIDADHVAAAVIVELGRAGAIAPDKVQAAITELDIAPEAPFALGR
jgi:pyruvate dehydrogenase E1 component